MTLAGNGQEHLDVETVSRELRLDQKSLQLLGKKLDAFDLLVLLVVASHTHFLTKARQANLLFKWNHVTCLGSFVRLSRVSQVC